MSCLLTYSEYTSSLYYDAFQACGTSGAVLSGYVTELLIEAESLIDNYIGRSLCIQSYTDRFKGNGSNVIWTRFTPITAISGFIYKSVMQTPYNSSHEFVQFGMASGNVNGYYLIDDSTGQIESICPFNRRQRFEITYGAGYSTIPEDIKTAMKILTTHLSQQIDSGNLANPDFNVTAVKVDTGGMNFGASNIIKNIVLKSMSEINNLPITVTRILEKYKYSKGLGY